VKEHHTIRINGDPREVERGTTIGSLLASLGLAQGVAVAVDRRIVPRAEHATTLLDDGSEVEVIRAVGGG
jgi:sulfur carrier protein